MKTLMKKTEDYRKKRSLSLWAYKGAVYSTRVNKFTKMLYDVQSLHYLANMKVPDAGIIIFRNIVRWTIRKQAFEFAKTAVETLCLAPDFNKDDIDATRICFVDNRRVVLSLEVGGELRGDPAFVSDARRLNKDYFVGVHNLTWSPDDDGNKTLFWEF